MQTGRDNFYYEETVQTTERRDGRNYQQLLEVESPLKRHFKTIMIGVVVSVIVAIMGCKYAYDDYQARQVQHDYQESFYDGTKMATVLPLVGLKATEHNDEFILLIRDYYELIIVASETGEIPKEELKKCNNSTRKVLGKEAEEFLVDDRWNLDCYGFVDGMTYFVYYYSINVAHDCGAISEEEYAEFEKKDEELLENLSHEEMMKMYPYLTKLMKKGLDKMPKSDAMYYDL